MPLAVVLPTMGTNTSPLLWAEKLMFLLLYSLQQSHHTPVVHVSRELDKLPSSIPPPRVGRVNGVYHDAVAVCTECGGPWVGVVCVPASSRTWYNFFSSGRLVDDIVYIIAPSLVFICQLKKVNHKLAHRSPGALQRREIV